MRSLNVDRDEMRGWPEVGRGDPSGLCAWLRDSLARKYDPVLEEGLPPEFEALVAGWPGDD